MGILNKLTLKHLSMNKKRTIVTIVGILLSTALMVGIGLLFSTARDNMIKELEQSNGDYHVMVNELSYQHLNKIKQTNDFKKIIYKQNIGFSKTVSNNDYKPYIQIYRVNDGYLNNLNLKSGRLPREEKEILLSEHLETNGGNKYRIGDKITLSIGERFVNSEKIHYLSPFNENETLKNNVTKEYTVVGIVERDVYEDYSSPGYSAFVKEDFTDENVSVFLTYKKLKGLYDKSSELFKDLKIKENIELNQDETKSNVSYNDYLITLYGENKYDNYNQQMVYIMAIILGLVSIGCIIVIYNSFAISVMERKKQFGLFASIGTTRKQIRKTVFFEAIIVGLIGIALGIISSYIGIYVVLCIINNLLSDIFTVKFEMAIYPLFIIIPIIFMIITVLISAYLPAKKASKVSPIDAIRQNDDIKIKGKKVKTNKLIKKIFGVEGDLALKNIKRNKRKYRITLLSLIVSIVLYLSVSTFLNYGFYSIDGAIYVPDFDIVVDYNSVDLTEDYLNNFKKIYSNPEVEEYIILKAPSIVYVNNLTDKYTSNYQKIIEKRNVEKEQKNTKNTYIFYYVTDDNYFNNFAQKNNVSNTIPIIINRYNITTYTDGNRRTESGKIFNDLNNIKISLCHISTLKNDENKNNSCDLKSILEVSLVQSMPFAVSYNTYEGNIIMLIGDSLYQELLNNNQISNENQDFMHAQLYLKVKEETGIKKIYDNIDNNHYQYYSVKDELTMIRNLIFVIKLLLYGFISLIILIGVTSVFNTINTSIALRRKEFAMLRSMGLTPKGFNKILYFESIFLGLKALLYSFPLSFAIMLLIRKSFEGAMVYDSFLIPWKAIAIVVFAVFIIVLVVMKYSTNKIKKENILDAIREENI